MYQYNFANVHVQCVCSWYIECITFLCVGYSKYYLQCWCIHWCSCNNIMVCGVVCISLCICTVHHRSQLTVSSCGWNCHELMMATLSSVWLCVVMCVYCVDMSIMYVCTCVCLCLCLYTCLCHDPQIVYTYIYMSEKRGSYFNDMTLHTHIHAHNYYGIIILFIQCHYEEHTIHTRSYTCRAHTFKVRPRSFLWPAIHPYELEVILYPYPDTLTNAIDNGQSHYTGICVPALMGCTLLH